MKEKTLKKPKNKEKIELKYAVQQKQKNPKFSAENADIRWHQQKIHVVFKIFFLLFWKFISYLVRVSSFKSITVLYPKKK